jgi:hypothetical protein
MHAHLSIPRLLGAVAYHMPRPHMAWPVLFAAAQFWKKPN